MTLDEQLARHARATGQEMCDLEQLVEDVEHYWNTVLTQAARTAYFHSLPYSSTVRVPDWESPDYVPTWSGWVRTWLKVQLRYRGRADDPWSQVFIGRPEAPTQLWLDGPYHVRRATFPLVVDLLLAMDAIILAHQLG